MNFRIDKSIDGDKRIYHELSSLSFKISFFQEKTAFQFALNADTRRRAVTGYYIVLIPVVPDISDHAKTIAEQAAEYYLQEVVLPNKSYYRKYQIK